ncbi:unnamed protein product [Arabis nemorensis]|uniref:Uncharacterized protein n=1 Tax=Arabis nemorensis TaxID=586526 RepID=A0A565BFC1_9BRAS|nr:unnamed protein product [Arabis nemorensis]
MKTYRYSDAIYHPSNISLKNKKSKDYLILRDKLENPVSYLMPKSNSMNPNQSKSEFFFLI